MEQYLQEHYEANYESESPIRLLNFERENLPELFKHLGFRRGAEIGVAAGANSILYCREIPNLELICVDAWIPFQTYRSGRPQTKRLMNHENNYKLAKQLLADYNVTFMVMDSMEAVKQIPENFLDFVYIDANHYYKYVMNDLIEWSKRVRPGGIVAGHDYLMARSIDVEMAVNEYTKKNEIKRWFITPTGIKFKQASYFWMKK